VFGLVNPVLRWPRSVAERLDDQQVEAILSHELAHVRRHDNLTGAAHMLVEVLFWFHPLVWWLGTRLVDERERACDEEVIRWGGDPQVYAWSILNICKHYIEVPLACVSGVTGSDLKHRIERIMKNEGPRTLNAWRKILITTGGIAAIVVATTVAGLVALFSTFISALTISTIVRLVAYMATCAALPALRRRADVPPPAFSIRAEWLVSAGAIASLYRVANAAVNRCCDPHSLSFYYSLVLCFLLRSRRRLTPVLRTLRRVHADIRRIDAMEPQACVNRRAMIAPTVLEGL
jgi:hypothetical protein